MIQQSTNDLRSKLSCDNRSEEIPKSEWDNLFIKILKELDYDLKIRGDAYIFYTLAVSGELLYVFIDTTDNITEWDHKDYGCIITIDTMEWLVDLEEYVSDREKYREVRNNILNNCVMINDDNFTLLRIILGYYFNPKANCSDLSAELTSKGYLRTKVKMIKYSSGYGFSLRMKDEIPTPDGSGDKYIESSLEEVLKFS